MKIKRAALAAALAALVGAAPAWAGDLAGAKAFVAWLYSHYPPQVRRDSFDVFGAQSTRIFHASLLDLIRQDDKAGDDQAPDLYGDPLCDCQNTFGMSFAVRSVRAGEFGRASATVVRRGEGSDDETITLDLALTGDGWRVYDVGTRDTPSLRAFLIDSTQAWKGR
ncbi:MAG TPA: hypothetical protein VGI30_05865 [Caulobacteraceae bacterium]|jgi:hypothetical protein